MQVKLSLGSSHVFMIKKTKKWKSKSPWIKFWPFRSFVTGFNVRFHTFLSPLKDLCKFLTSSVLYNIRKKKCSSCIVLLLCHALHPSTSWSHLHKQDLLLLLAYTPPYIAPPWKLLELSLSCIHFSFLILPVGAILSMKLQVSAALQPSETVMFQLPMYLNHFFMPCVVFPSLK